MKHMDLLIGPKGSGKSFIGELFQRRFRIPFVRVESWVREMKRDRAVDDENYVREVFQVIEDGIAQELNEKDPIVCESTGVTASFDKMLSNLQSKYKVVLIRVKADKEICLHRVKTRDQSIHINVSDSDVHKINDAVEQKQLVCDFEINNNAASEAQLMATIAAIVAETGKN